MEQRFYEKSYEAGRLIERLVDGERNRIYGLDYDGIADEE